MFLLFTSIDFFMNISSTVSRYIFSGFIASVVLFGSLVFFREVLGIWYLYSSTLAFILSFITSFLLHKLWTFRNLTGSNAYKQLVLFFIVSLINLGINGSGMFILVDKMGIWYFISQIFVTAFIAIWSFFVYRLIFSRKNETEEQEQNINKEIRF